MPTLAQGTVQLRDEQITAPQAFTTLSVDDAKEELLKIPGSTTLIEAEDFRLGRVSSIEDILDLSPSVYVQSRHGGSETRLSVRGSGIRQTFNAVGVRILRNGIPISEADGNSRPQIINPLIVQYAEVYPGANGLVYGSSALGGAINFITPTGYTADRAQLRYEVGSFDHSSVQFSSGDVLGDGYDYYFSVSELETDGFRPNGKDENENFYGNLGKRFDDTWEGRLHVSVINSNLELPGSIMKSQVNSGMLVANASSAFIGSHRNFDVTRVDLQLTGQFSPDEKLDMTFSSQWLDMHHPLPFGGTGGGAINLQDRTDYTFSTIYQGTSDMFGRENEYSIGFFAAVGEDENPRLHFDTQVLNRFQTSDATSLELYGQDKIAMTDQLSLVAGLHLANASREQNTTFGFGAGKVDNDYTGISPKIGLIYEPNEETQYFGNISRSFEPPTTGAISNSTGNIDEQTAWTLEVGARSDSGNTSFQSALYYSMVSDEILTIANPAGSATPFETGNADTVHFGIELGASHFFPLAVLSKSKGKGMQNPRGIRLQGTLTYNNFEFDDGSAFDGNSIPGIPDYVLRGEAVYENAGFFAGINTELASDYNVDFANTFEADSYAIFGATTGYDSGQGWSCFLDIRNILDEEYASNTGIATNQNGMDGNLFNTGMPFAVFMGVELTM